MRVLVGLTCVVALVFLGFELSDRFGRWSERSTAERVAAERAAFLAENSDAIATCNRKVVYLRRAIAGQIGNRSTANGLLEDVKACIMRFGELVDDP